MSKAVWVVRQVTHSTPLEVERWRYGLTSWTNFNPLSPGTEIESSGALAEALKSIPCEVALQPSENVAPVVSPLQPPCGVTRSVFCWAVKLSSFGTTTLTVSVAEDWQLPSLGMKVTPTV